MAHSDYLIVGQGIAGTMLSALLGQRGRSFVVIDDGDAHSSSMLAAGLVHPLTGRRFVTSWMYDALLPEALRLYRHLEELLQICIVSEIQVWRSLAGLPDPKAFLQQMAADERASYLLSAEAALPDTAGLSLTGSWCCIRGVRVDMPTLIRHHRHHLMETGRLQVAKFDHTRLKISGQQVCYDDYTASMAIFCEGHQMRYNPYFSTDWLLPSLGEILHLRSADLRLAGAVKRQFFLLPMHEQRFWFGAVNSWQAGLPYTTRSGFDRLLKAAQDSLSSPFEVVQHLGAVRPAVRDRRPLIGRHATWPQLAVFNGLGTKGASLAPYWAERLVQHIEDGAPLSPEVDIARTRSLHFCT